MTNTVTTKKNPPAKASKPDTAATKPAAEGKKLSRLDQLQHLIIRDGGANITELTNATGWQQHSVRGAIAGALKKRGLSITSEKIDGVRVYHGMLPA